MALARALPAAVLVAATLTACTGSDVFDAAASSVRRVDAPAYDAGSFRTVTAVGRDTVLVLGGYDASIPPTDAAYLVTIPG